MKTQSLTKGRNFKSDRELKYDDTDWDYSPNGHLWVNGWAYEEGVNSATWLGFIYSRYAPIDLNFALGLELWSNFTRGYPASDFEHYGYYDGYIDWLPNNGSGSGWSWDDADEYHNSLPDYWPSGFNFSFYANSYSDQVGQETPVYYYVGQNYSYNVYNKTTEAMMTKTFDSFLHNGTVVEPYYWYPTWQDIYVPWAFGVSFDQGNVTEPIYINFNATSQ